MIPDGLSEAETAEATRLLAELDGLLAENPLWKLQLPGNPLADPAKINEKQWEWFEAKTRIVAAFAGNRFGKTTALVVRAIVDCLDEKDVPGFLLPAKRWFPGRNTKRQATHARIVCETTETLHSVLLPAFQEWIPKSALKTGKWDGSFQKQLKILEFKNGSFIDFKTYGQEAADMAGAALHFVGYDEPPPKDIRGECRMRLTDFQGYEMFALTPLKANTGWIRREIWKNRESPDITVVKGSTWDNKTLDRGEVEFSLSQYDETERQAREFGDFMEFGGLVYPSFERCVVEPFPKQFIQSFDDHVVSIDPGIRNCAITWAAYDSDLKMHLYDEVLIQDGTPADYVKAIRAKNREWGIPDEHVSYVMDPASVQRSQATGENVDGEMMRLGVYAAKANNTFEAGVLQIRQRIQHKRLEVSKKCVHTRDEADDYALEQREDGVVKPVKGRDHFMDSMRYSGMARTWDPIQEVEAARHGLGFVANTAPDLSKLVAGNSAPPMGAMS